MTTYKIFPGTVTPPLDKGSLALVNDHILVIVTSLSETSVNGTILGSTSSGVAAVGHAGSWDRSKVARFTGSIGLEQL